MTRPWGLQTSGTKSGPIGSFFRGSPGGYGDWRISAFPGSQSRGRFLESSFKANIQKLHWDVGALGKAPVILLLKCPLVLAFHISWATGKVSISFHSLWESGWKTKHLIGRTFWGWEVPKNKPRSKSSTQTLLCSAWTDDQSMWSPVPCHDGCWSISSQPGLMAGTWTMCITTFEGSFSWAFWIVTFSSEI